MTALTWDAAGQRLYETGVDHGVLYIPNGLGVYDSGYAWNGLTAVTESPSGAAASAQYADNLKYLSLVAAEEFGATIEAFTYPDEFGQCDGTAVPAAGIAIGQQIRKLFGLSYRTQLGNDLEGVAHGYKLHLVYNCQAAPSEKAYKTMNDSPEAITFSWQMTTTPAAVSGFKPTSVLTIESYKAVPANLTALELILYGSVGINPRLPLPDEVVTLFGGAPVAVRMVGANAPTYDSGTHVVTLPTVTNITWKINGVTKTAGAQPALTVGQTSLVTAVAAAGFMVTGDNDWVFDY